MEERLLAEEGRIAALAERADTAHRRLWSMRRERGAAGLSGRLK